MIKTQDLLSKRERETNQLVGGQRNLLVEGSVVSEPSTNTGSYILSVLLAILESIINHGLNTGR